MEDKDVMTALGAMFGALAAGMRVMATAMGSLAESLEGIADDWDKDDDDEA